MGHFPIVPAQKKFLLVATDYFAKWVKAKAFSTIKDKDVPRFMEKHYFSFWVINLDNKRQFDSSNYKNFCVELGIKNLNSSPHYPQANWQTEATNKSPLDALKKRLQGANKC